MQKKGKRVFGCLAVLFAVFLVLYGLSGLMQRKESDCKYKLFFEQQEDFDVLLIGTSHMINAVYPLELWNEYGIVSYNLGGHGNPLPVTYWILQNALDYTTPQAVVIDCYNLHSNERMNQRYEYTHISFDAFPLSATKLKTVYDLLLKPRQAPESPEEPAITGEKHTPLGLLWDFSVYHSRWEELTKEDFVILPDLEKGGDMRPGYSEPAAWEAVPREDKLTGDTLGVIYLKRIIEDCEARGIEVILTYLPFPANRQDWQDANRVYDIASEYNVKYINFLARQDVNYETDCCDEASHLNPSGGRKVTAQLGKFLAENCGIPDRRNDPACQHWNTDYAVYRDYVAQQQQGQHELTSYLAMAANRNYNMLFLIEDTDLLKQTPYKELLENLGITAPEQAVPLLAVCQNGQMQQQFTVEGDSVTLETVLGKVEINGDVVKCSGEEMLSVLGPDQRAGLRAVIWNAEDGTLVGGMNFDWQSRAVLY